MDNSLSPELLLAVNTGSSTQYSDKPIDGKKEEIVIQHLEIRQAIRNELEIGEWRNAHRVAESRYYPNRSTLYDIYEDVLLDGHLSGVIAKRIASVLNKQLVFERDDEQDDTVCDLMNTIQFRRVLTTILETQLWGISGLEFIPGPQLEARTIPRKHIKPKWQRITYEQNGSDGIDYTTLANVWILGDPEDLGLLLKCAPNVIYKRNTRGDWAQYIEIFGMPMRIIYYNGHDDQAKIELKQVLDSTGSALALMIPEGTRFEIPDMPATNGTGELQGAFIASLDAENSIIILGNTETTTTQKSGTGAQSKTHQEQQHEIMRSDMFYLLAHLNSEHFRNILNSYGWQVDGGKFGFASEPDVAMLKERIAIDTQLPESLPISDDYWYETYGIPKPDNYNAMKSEFEEAQKELKQQNEIGANPKNKPAKASKDIKLTAPAEPGGLFAMVRSFLSFFLHARR